MSDKSLAPKRDGMEGPLYLQLPTSRREAFAAVLGEQYRKWMQQQRDPERKAVA